MIRRLEPVRANLQHIAEADAAEAADRLAYETGPEGESQRRYTVSRERAMNRRIDRFLKVREAGIDGTLDQVDLGPDEDARWASAYEPSEERRPAPRLDGPEETNPDWRK